MKFKILLTVFCFFSLLHTFEISGRVVNEDKEPLGNVIISNHGIVVISNHKGYFRLEEIAEQDTINFHKIGFADKNIIAQNIRAKIVLSSSAIEIDGILVNAEKYRFVFPEIANKIVIEVTNPTENSVAEILSKVPSLQMKGVDMIGEKQTISLLGHKAKHTLIMLDGVPLNSAGQDFDLSSIPAEIIANIEIIKNNVQTGSGSMAGIININTKKTDGQFNFHIGQIIGSFGLQKYFLNSSIANAKFYSFLYLAQSSTENDFNFLNQSSSNNNLKNNEKNIKDFNFTFGANLLPFEIEYKCDLQKYDKQFLTPQNIDIYDGSSLAGFTNRQRITFSKALNNFFLNSNLFYFNEKSTYDNTASDWFSEKSHHYLAARGVNTKIAFNDEVFTSNFGINYKREDFEYLSESNPNSNIEALFEENLASFGDMKIRCDFFPLQTNFMLAGRVDKFSSFDDFTTFRISTDANYESIITTTIGGSYGSGFTVPSFYDLYWNDVQAHGNKNLKAEESKGFELFGKLEFADHYCKVSAYKNKIENLIHWCRVTNYWRPENIGIAEISNLEVDLQMNFKTVTCGSSYLQTVAYDKTVNGDFYDKYLPFIPKSKFQVYWELKVNNLATKINYARVGKQYTTPDQLSEELVMPAYDLTDVEVSYLFKWKKIDVRIVGVVKNIFNENYELYKYMPQPGRNWQLNFNLNYKK
ncbi:MAG: TonB-dependent receptor plug domain-containing protein [Candidatus Cloacimonetes bacterium]|jgi:vitamin B12 transporter|nr:TonB-dependent receptor plug domain-containing protein [Candidatus Cloacimonadota bacterium]MBT6994920.1 TonB-dependent receptor plug domain-containing protein [Candidatus Cloacimonadota bacterium]